MQEKSALPLFALFGEVQFLLGGVFRLRSSLFACVVSATEHSWIVMQFFLHTSQGLSGC